MVLEIAELPAVDQVALRQAIDDRRIDFRFQVPVLRFWIYERNDV